MFIFASKVAPGAFKLNVLLLLLLLLLCYTSVTDECFICFVCIIYAGYVYVCWSAVNCIRVTAPM